MRAYGRDEDDRVFGMAEGAACGEVVGCGAGGGGDADAIGLDGRKVLVVAEKFDGGHCWGRLECFTYEDIGLRGLKGGRTGIRASVNNYVIEDFMGPIWSVGVVVLSLCSYQLLNEIVMLSLFLRPHYCSLESEA